MNNHIFRWGIIGTGAISHEFEKGVKVIPDAAIGAAASLSGKNPNNIQAETYYRTYEELAADKTIDAVYVGNINPAHYDSVKLCLEHGKPVLCEKPLTINARECKELQDIAQKHDTFFMEAMWTRFIPASIELQKICETKKHGNVRSIQLSFGFDMPAKERVNSKELGGGALLDLGVYGISFCNMLLGEHPTVIQSWADLNAEGVDVTSSVQLKYPCGCISDMIFSVNCNLRNEAYIIFDQAEISVPFFWRPEQLIRYAPNKPFVPQTVQEEINLPVKGNGYEYEAMEVQRCLEEGLKMSPSIPHEDSLKIMETMDAVRKQCNITFPQDQL